MLNGILSCLSAGNIQNRIAKGGQFCSLVGAERRLRSPHHRRYELLILLKLRKIESFRLELLQLCSNVRHPRFSTLIKRRLDDVLEQLHGGSADHWHRREPGLNNCVSRVAFGTDADANAKIVLDALKDRTPSGKSGRVAAIDFVEFLGPKARPSVPELIEALKDKSLTGRPSGGQVRERAAKVLGRMGTSATAAIRPLTDALKDSERGMREAAADALGRFGPEAVVAAPKLREMIRNNPESAAIAQAALDRIEPMKKMD